MDISAAIMFLIPQAKWTFDGNGNEYTNIIWLDEFYDKPTEEEFAVAYKYVLKNIELGYDYRLERLKHYPTADQQLAMIYDLGIDGWKQQIDKVKAKYPKPQLE